MDLSVRVPRLPHGEVLVGRKESRDQRQVAAVGVDTRSAVSGSLNASTPIFIKRSRWSAEQGGSKMGRAVGHPKGERHGWREYTQQARAIAAP